MINRLSTYVLLAGMLTASAAAAAPLGAEPIPAKPAALSPAGVGGASPLNADDLAAVSAGQSPAAIALTNQNLTAVNSGNLITAQNIATGQVSFANGAFQGFTGIGNFVVNTGNNNNLQGSLSVTVIPLQ